MSLKGIDISNWQKGLDLSKVACDFVIIKATEGKSYVDPSCDIFFQQALKLGKKIGIYHFANNSDNSAEQEANWFITNTRGYIGKAIPVLDWEDSGHTGDVAWALKWLQLVEEAYDCKPLIYMSESVVNANDWSSVANADYGLWVAKYRDNNADYNYNMSNAGSKPNVKHWGFYAIWQWTSSGRLNGWNGNLDCNEFYGDTNAWDAYVGNNKKVPDLQYQVHLENIGWTNIQNAGEQAGTTGEARKLEAVKFFANNGLEIKYRAHVQDIGWQDWKSNGEVAGTTGQNKAIEAIEIQANKILNAEEHLQDVGWMPHSNGTNIVLGTVGKALRLEAFKISVVG